MTEKRQITTMCPMNCLLTQCGMTVEVEGNTLLSLKGDQHNPDSRGFLCIRGQASREIFANPKRLLQPLRRVGERGEDRWEVCSWDEAYAMIVEAIEQTQPERVGLWRGHDRLSGQHPGESLRGAGRFPAVECRDCVLGDGRLWSGTDRHAQNQHQRGYGRQFAHHSTLGRDPCQPA